MIHFWYGVEDSQVQEGWIFAFYSQFYILEFPSVEEDKGKCIICELKTKVGQPTDETSYKKYVRKIEDFSTQEWIDVLKDLKEICGCRVQWKEVQTSHSKSKYWLEEKNAVEY
jgi:hypothetical protein